MVDTVKLGSNLMVDTVKLIKRYELYIYYTYRYMYYCMNIMYHCLDLLNYSIDIYVHCEAKQCLSSYIGKYI